MKRFGVLFAVVLTIVFTFIVAGGQYRGSSNLSVNNQQDIAQARDARNVWYVNKSGADASGGTSWDTAKLTVGAAVTAASAGDKIVIGPGSYAVAVDSSAKNNLEFVGAGLQTIITSALHTLTVGDGTVLKDFQVVTTGTAYRAIDLGNESDVRLYRMTAIGEADGIYAGDAVRLRIEDSYIFGTYDSINLYNATDWIFVNSVFETDGTNGTGTDARAINTLGSGSGAMYGGKLIARRNDVSAKAIVAFGCADTAGHFLFDGVQFIAEHQSGSASGIACGVANTDGSGSPGSSIALVNCLFYTSQAGSGAEYHLNQATGTLAVADTLYDIAKTNGTITDLRAPGPGDQSTYELVGNVVLVDATTPPLILAWTSPASTEVDLSGSGNAATYSNFVATDRVVKGTVWALSFYAGNDEYLTVGDDAAFSWDDTGDNPWSICAWVQVVATAADQVIISKWDEHTNGDPEDREWMLWIDSAEKLNFRLEDESVPSYEGRETNALSTGWHFLAVTYDSAGGANASAGIFMYDDGILAASGPIDNGAYTAMEAGGSDVLIGGKTGTADAVDAFFQGDMGVLWIEDTDISAAQVWEYYLKTRGYYGE